MEGRSPNYTNVGTVERYLSSRMRLVSFLVMVFGALLSQYLLQTWLVNSEEEKKESWDRHVNWNRVYIDT